MTTEPPISDAELDAMQQRADAASKRPWQSFIEDRDHTCGDSFIRVGGFDDDEVDMYVSRDRQRASDTDLDFIAAASQDIPRLIAEIKRLRNELDRTTHLKRPNCLSRQA